jgi:hypothetical protein
VGESLVHERWARFRFSVIGALLAAPPHKGALQGALRDLAQRTWSHPKLFFDAFHPPAPVQTKAAARAATLASARR